MQRVLTYPTFFAQVDKFIYHCILPAASCLGSTLVQLVLKDPFSFLLPFFSFSTLAMKHNTGLGKV